MSVNAGDRRCENNHLRAQEEKEKRRKKRFKEKKQSDGG